MENINDVIGNITNNELETFINGTDSVLKVNTDIKETKIDNSWLEVLENTLSNIDKIVRNPRMFIIQEEDVVIVEKTKKVSQETIKHLAEHCENIQDINNEGDVVPKKLLNVHKEDSTDIYENRFIFTLVKRLDTFINKQLENLNINSTKEVKKDVEYNATTKIDNKKVLIKLKLKEEDIVNIDEVEDGISVKDRIMSCYEIIKGFSNTVMIKSLSNCTEVMNPIRKTNMILKEPNFQKAYVLWEYLDNFEFKDPKVIKYDSYSEAKKEVKDEFDLAYYINDNALDDDKENFLKNNNTFDKVKNIVSNYIYEDDNDINMLKEKIQEYYDNALNDKINRENEIRNIINEYFDIHACDMTNIKESLLN